MPNPSQKITVYCIDLHYLGAQWNQFSYLTNIQLPSRFLSSTKKIVESFLWVRSIKVLLIDIAKIEIISAQYVWLNWLPLWVIWRAIHDYNFLCNRAIELQIWTWLWQKNDKYGTIIAFLWSKNICFVTNSKHVCLHFSIKLIKFGLVWWP